MMAVLREEFGQLEADLQAANRSSTRARRDRIEGFKQASKDIFDAKDRADREWR